MNLRLSENRIPLNPLGTPLINPFPLIRAILYRCVSIFDFAQPCLKAITSEDKLVLENVSHAPVYPAFGPSAELAKERLTKPWYGSPSILQQWLPWLSKNRLE